MAVSSKIKVMISSRCDDRFPARTRTSLTDVRRELKTEIESAGLFGKNLFEVWINEEPPRRAGHGIAGMYVCKPSPIATSCSSSAQRRGVNLGGYRGTMMTEAMRKAASEVITKRAKARAADLAPTIADLQAAGATSLQAIAAGLNERGIPTARGTGTWSATQVMRVLAPRRST
jgi:hypothetical protein